MIRETIADRRIGVLVVNSGSPDAPNFSSVRRYLAQFLGDPRVIELPKWIWWPILHGVVLNLRPLRSARLYQRIWTENGSPLVQTTLQIAAGLSVQLSANLRQPVPVLAGMRYGNPSMAKALSQLQAAGLDWLIILPLFPQYSGTTSGTILDAVFRELSTWRSIPKLQVISHYHDHPAYIQALSDSVMDQWGEDVRAKRLLFSFHGIPLSYAEAGDPYPDQCRTTARLTAESLGLRSPEWRVAFQSRFGRQTWLQPYTHDALIELGKAGQPGLSVICPGFAADCLETLDEIDREGREIFEAAGGGGFAYIPALNSSSAHLRALSRIVLDVLPGGRNVD